jgi:nucleotidyltransferase/DNA polymerase involved in DNA repair
MFRTISILLVMEDLTTQTRSHSLETPTNSLEVLKKVVRQLTTSYLREEGRLLVRRIGVKVSGLVRAYHQVSLREFL